MPYPRLPFAPSLGPPLRRSAAPPLRGSPCSPARVRCLERWSPSSAASLRRRRGRSPSKRPPSSQPR